MLRYVHQLIANYVRLLSGDGQLMLRGVFRASSLKTAACCSQKQLDHNNELSVAKTVIILCGFVTMSIPYHITHSHYIHYYYKNI